MQGCELLLNLGKNKVNIRGSKLTAGLCGRVWEGGGPSFWESSSSQGQEEQPLTSSAYMASQACALCASQYWLGRQASKGVLSIMGSP